MARIVIVGSTSAVGQACGARLSVVHEVAYAGRQDADYPFDLETPDLAAFEAARFDVVLITAADFGGPSAQEMARAERVNALGTLALCELAQKVGATQVVLISTISSTYSPGDAYYNAYALSKRHGEELAALYCATHGLALTILRPTQLYDTAGRCRKHQALLYSMIDKARAGEDITLYGTNDAVRNYLFLDDLCELVGRAIAQPVTGLYHCASQDMRLSEIAQTLQHIFESKGIVRFLADKPDIVSLPPIAGESAFTRLAFQPTTLADGIRAIRRRS